MCFSYSSSFALSCRSILLISLKKYFLGLSYEVCWKISYLKSSSPWTWCSSIWIFYFISGFCFSVHRCYLCFVGPIHKISWNFCLFLVLCSLYICGLQIVVCKVISYYWIWFCVCLVIFHLVLYGFSRVLLNVSVERNHLCLSLQAFSLLSIKLTVGFCRCLFTKLRTILLSPVCWNFFHHEWMLNFLKCFFYASVKMVIWSYTSFVVY